MKYFENIPNVVYKPDDTEDSAILKNLFFKYVMNIDGINLFQKYIITEVKRLDQISYELYGTTEHWWIIALMNDIQDIIFDLPISTEILHLIAKDYIVDLEATETTEGENYYLDEDGSISEIGMPYFITEFERIEVLNEEKRVITVVRPNEIYKVLTLISENI